MLRNYTRRMFKKYSINEWKEEIYFGRRIRKKLDEKNIFLWDRKN